MQGRTFIRIMADILFVNNAFCRALSALVNFCKEQQYYNRKELKFFEKEPLNKLTKDSVYKNRFIFQNTTRTGVRHE